MLLLPMCFTVNMEHSTCKHVHLQSWGVERSVDRDQLVQSEVSWSGSTVFSNLINLFSTRHTVVNCFICNIESSAIDTSISKEIN